jgi:hypothetical protein
MSELFGDLSGVVIYFDDFLVPGETMEELHFNLRQVLVCCRQHNHKLKLKKCKFFLKEVLWLGHIIGEGLVKVDPSKVEAIVNMTEPSGKADLARLLGMATYVFGQILQQPGRRYSYPARFTERVVCMGLGGAAKGCVG